MCPSEENIEYRKIEGKKDAKILTICAIKEMQLKTNVSLVCFIHVDDSLKTQFVDPFSQQIADKTEMISNDEMDNIKLVFCKDAFHNLQAEGEGTKNSLIKELIKELF